jgi:hypothetical protein
VKQEAIRPFPSRIDKHLHEELQAKGMVCSHS